MHSKLFEAALGVSDPWFVSGVDFDAAAKLLTIQIDRGGRAKSDSGISGTAGA